MASEWKRKPFQELIDERVLEISDGYRAKNSDLGGDGPIFLRAGQVRDTHIEFAGVERFHASLANRVVSKMSLAGDAIITTKGNSTGRTAFVTDEMPPFVYSPHLSYWRSLDEKTIAQSFLRFWVRSPELQTQVASMSRSTDMAPYLSLIDQKRLMMTIPPVSDQLAIGSILSALDDKIEISRKASFTLESLARVIFKSWFVDFDPVRAKAEGREPEGMDADTAALFPDEFVESSLGSIPVRFGVSDLRCECAISMGQSPPGSTYNESEEGLPFFQGRADFTNVFPKRRVYCTEPSRFASAEDVLLSVRAPVGDINIALEDCAIGRGVAAIRHKSKSTAYTWCLLKSQNASFDSYDTEGTVFGAISGKDLKGLKVIAPSPAIVDAYATLCEPMFSKLKFNELQARGLTTLRDTLLPRLISGKLRVPEAEAMLSEVI